ncbi:MAG: hypothetical protein RSC06_13800 [Clostridia bacterium]
MKIKYIQSGKCENVNDSYGSRLIEQGKAVYVGETDKTKVAKKESAVKPDGDI